MKTINYFSLKMDLDGEGIVTIYKNFVVTAEFFTGPSGEYFMSRVYRSVDDLEQFDLVDARLELASEKWADRLSTEGEALMAAFMLIERGRCGEVID